MKILKKNQLDISITCIYNYSQSETEIDENEMNIVCCSPWNRKTAAPIAILVKALLFRLFLFSFISLL